MSTMSKTHEPSSYEAWALLRFAVVSPLLVSPSGPGELQRALRKAASQAYTHPRTGEMVRFGLSTIERWYYLARDADNPVEALRRSVRSDAGQQKAMHPELLRVLERQYRANRDWSYQLHADNLRALVEDEHPEWGPPPSYQSVRRRMVERGWLPVRGRAARRREERAERREIRSFEAEYTHALWHLDFHETARKVAGPDGRYFKPKACAILDDHSRLCCHVQWFEQESAHTLFWTLSQAFCRRGLPRALMTDNGGAMLAAETRNGLDGYSVTHKTTLAESPEQNGKQERFWGTLEGRLMKMLRHVEEPTVELLNTATLAWVEQEYHRSRHDELGCTPLERAIETKSLSRPAPPIAELRQAFTCQQTRTLRRSDCTISIQGVRFELPGHLRNLRRVPVRFRRWDLSLAWVTDPRTGEVIARIRPLDKHANADGRRRVRDVPEPVEPATPDEPIPPLLRRLLRDFAATGLPSPYLPFELSSSLPHDEENPDA